MRGAVDSLPIGGEALPQKGDGERKRPGGLLVDFDLEALRVASAPGCLEADC